MVSNEWECTHLGHVEVVEHAVDDPGQRVGLVVVVRRRHERRDGVLQRVAQHGVEGQVGPLDLTLHPVVAPQRADLSPQAVQVLQHNKPRDQI